MAEIEDANISSTNGIRTLQIPQSTRAQRSHGCNGERANQIHLCHRHRVLAGRDDNSLTLGNRVVECMGWLQQPNAASNDIGVDSVIGTAHGELVFLSWQVTGCNTHNGNVLSQSDDRSSRGDDPGLIQSYS